MYQYLLWDVDGTILDFLAAEAYAIRTLFGKFGLGVCTDEMVRAYSQINVEFWQALERNEMTKTEILVGRFRAFFERYGIDPTLAEPFNHAYQTALGDHIVFIRDAEETLRAEKGRYTLAAVTNGTKVAQTKKLARSGLDQIFDAVFISEDVGFEKPNAAYFETVFRNLGVTDKRSVLLIGDSLTGDMRGAANMGIDACWFNPNHAVNAPNVPITYEIDDLSKLAAILERDAARTS